MKYSIIIPCFNEGQNISALIESIRPFISRYDMEFILIENGSSDNSREMFKSFVNSSINHIKLIYLDKNQGYGYGVQQGLKAAKGEYVGWIHADMQIPLKKLVHFIKCAERYENTEKLFIKGFRQNRSNIERLFTNGQAVYNSLLLKTKLNDIGAIPVLFQRDLLKDFDINSMPNDFSIELFVYYMAVKKGYIVHRIKVNMEHRKSGESSWNKGIKSKIRQSILIFKDSIKIKQGEKVL